MLRPMVFVLSMALAVPFATAANPGSETGTLSAAEIVEKNVAARGGLQAWRAVQTMSWTGKMGIGGNQRATLPLPDPSQKAARKVVPTRPAAEMEVPFTMDLKRTRKMRFELEFNGKTAVQVFDGTNGWKVRPYLNRLDVESYTPEEKKTASQQSDLDGPLVDYAAKGTVVAFEGIEKVDGRDTYKLKLTMKEGQSIHLWIDSETFLDTKMEGQPRRLDGMEHPVEVYFRDYREVNGLQIPYILETKVLPVVKTAIGLKDPPVPAEKIVIEKVLVNPKLEESLFTKPAFSAATAGPGVRPAKLSN